MGIRKINVLLIEEGSSLITLRVVRCLGITNLYKIHILSFTGKLIPSFRYSRYITSCYEYVPRDEEHMLDLIRKTIKSSHAEITIPLMEKQTKIIASHIGEFSGVCLFPPLPDPCTLEVVINKYLLSKWLLAKGFDDNQSVNIQKLNQGNVRASLHFPLLIKPFWGSSGEGIVSIGSPDQLDPMIDSIRKKNGEFLIQPYYAGKDIDLSALVDKGRIITYTIQRTAYDKKTLKYSKSIEFTRDPSLLEFCEKIFKELNYSGIAHLDFRLDPDRGIYHLVDFNARYWSTLCGSLLAGINFPHLVCLAAQNSPISHQPYRPIRFLSSENPFYILGSSLKLSGKSFQLIANNELYYGMRDPLPMVFNFVNLLKTKFAWHFTHHKGKIPA